MATSISPGQSVYSFLGKAVLPEFHFAVNRWKESAGAREISAAKLLKAICESAGSKRLRAVSRSGNRTHAKLPKRFNSPMKDSRLQGLLQSPLLKRIFYPEVIQYIQLWLSLQRDPDHEGLLFHLLDSLKALSVLRPAPPRQAHSLKRVKTPMNIAQMKDFKTAFEMASPMERSQLQLKGNGKLTEWVSNADVLHTSNYRETYTDGFNFSRKLDTSAFYTSALWTLMPEPRVNFRLLRK